MKHLAIVLLPAAKLPPTKTLAAACNAVVTVDEEKSVVSMKLGGHSATLALVPTPVPHKEAEANADYSASRFMQYDPPGPHAAHLLVVFEAEASTAKLAALELFCGLLGSIAQASSAEGIYWGAAHATHSTAFVVETLEAKLAPVALWSGVAFAKAAGRDSATSFISLGLGQLGLSEIEVTCPEADPSVGLDMLFNLLSYVAKRGEDLGDGDDLGEGVTIRRIPSPLDASKTVMRADLP